jgi:hypothetical protein
MSRAPEQPRGCAPCLGFNRSQDERAPRLRVGFGPFFFVYQGKRLTREPARLPAFDCSADGRPSEVDRNAQHTRGYRAKENEPPNPSGANFFRRSQVKIVLLCDGTWLLTWHARRLL